MTYIIRSNLLVSLAAVSFYLTGHWLLNRNSHEVLPASIIEVFSATFIIYNLPKISKIFLSKKNFFYILVLIVNIILLFIASYNIPSRQVIYLVHLGAISFLYNFPFKVSRIPFIPGRSIPFLKIILIAYVWASIGSVYCGFESSLTTDKDVISVFIVQFLFIVSITLPFDIRDYVIDKNIGIKTIPGLVGIERTRYLGYALALAYMLFASITLSSRLSFIVSGILIILLIKNSGERRNEFYYTGLIDGFIIANFLLMWVLY